jgi:hypothetical protein
MQRSVIVSIKRSVIVGVVMAASSVILLAQNPAPGKDPIIGTWNLNLQKSKFVGAPAPRSETRRYEVTEEGYINYIRIGVDSHGSPTFSQATYKYDGKDYPIYSQANLPLFYTLGVKPGTQAYRVVDPNTVQLTPKDNTGKITFDGVRTRSVSRDGKTLTDIQKGTNALGETVDIVQIFDKLELQSVRTGRAR